MRASCPTIDTIVERPVATSSATMQSERSVTCPTNAISERRRWFVAATGAAAAYRVMNCRRPRAGTGSAPSGRTASSSTRGVADQYRLRVRFSRDAMFTNVADRRVVGARRACRRRPRRCRSDPQLDVGDAGCAMNRRSVEVIERRAPCGVVLVATGVLKRATIASPSTLSTLLPKRSTIRHAGLRTWRPRNASPARGRGTGQGGETDHVGEQGRRRTPASWRRPPAECAGGQVIFPHRTSVLGNAIGTVSVRHARASQRRAKA